MERTTSTTADRRVRMSTNIRCPTLSQQLTQFAPRRSESRPSEADYLFDDGRVRRVAIAS
jgi:hypothetical protein